MKSKIAAFVSAVALLVALNPLPAAATSSATVVAGKSFRATGGNSSNSVYETATDSAGNLYVMGQSNTDFVDSDGGTTTVFNFQYSSTDNIYVAKYNAAGVKQWVQEIGNTSNESASTLAVAPDGKIAVGGRLCMPLVVAPSISISPISQFCDAFFAVLDTDGNGLWAKVFAEPNQFNPNHWVSDLEFDAAGNLYAAIQNGDMLDFSNYGIDGTTFSISGGANYDGQVIVKYNPTQQLQWVKALPYGFYVNGQTLNIEPNGDILMGGVITRATTFDSLGTFTPTANDGIVARISGSTRAFTIIKLFGGAGNQQVTGLTRDSTGAVIALARIESTAIVNGLSYASLGGQDALVAKFSGSTWTTNWATRIGGTGNDYFKSVKVDADDRIYTSGSIAAAVTLGSIGTFTPGVSSGQNGLVIGLESDGAFAWAKQSFSAAQGFSNFGGGVSVSGSSVYASGSMGTNQTTTDGVTITGNAWNCCNNYGAGFFIKVSTAPIGGSIVQNNVVAENPNMIAVTKVSPRVVDETAANSKITLSGRNLDKVVSVSQAKSALKHKLLPSGDLEIELPTLTVGAHDLLLTGVGFHFTLQNAYRVQNVELISISKFASVKHAAASSKIAKATVAQMPTKSVTSCVLNLNTKTNAKTAKLLVAQARNYCNALSLKHDIQIVRSVEPTKLELQIRGW